MDIEKEFPKLIFSINDNIIYRKILDGVSSPRVNIARYSNGKYDYVNYSINTSFNKESPESYISAFMKSNEEETFILLMSLIKNCYNGSSISRAYKVAKRAEDGPIAELATIVEEHKEDLLDYIIDNINYIQEFYSSAALLRDSELLRRIKEVNKPIKRPSVLPDLLPFRFEHRPVETIRQWIFNVLYDVKMKSFRTQYFICRLSECLIAFFSHYLIDNDIQGFFKRVSSESSQTHLWMTLRKQSNWSVAWAMQWLQAYKDGNLIQCFIDILNNEELIREKYAECSSVRDQNSIDIALWSMNTFVNLELPAAYEVEKSTDFSLFGFFKGFSGN